MTANVLLRHTICRNTNRLFLWTALLLAAALGWLLADGLGKAAADAAAEPDYLTGAAGRLCPRPLRFGPAKKFALKQASAAGSSCRISQSSSSIKTRPSSSLPTAT